MFANSPYSIGGLVRDLQRMYNLHPSERDFQIQQFGAGLVPQYGEFMRGRARDEQNSQYRARVGLTWDDAVSPWVASAYSGAMAHALGNATRQVSTNAMSLYKGFSNYKKRENEKKARQNRRMMYDLRHSKYKYKWGDGPFKPAWL